MADCAGFIAKLSCKYVMLYSSLKILSKLQVRLFQCAFVRAHTCEHYKGGCVCVCVCVCVCRDDVLAVLMESLKAWDRMKWWMV